ncbi:M42 family metallopeptidase [Desulfuromonas acetoxidans]|uniref:M42 family metallopeptidase n=1 Tax=Desulfuromonas acetoxidans TaxID=891 RepID=UPI00292CC4AF|nr:M42 family metallopeptidase [Desulfuromonas acetoxidans]
MEQHHYDLLKEMSQTPSPSGFEQPIQRVVRRVQTGLADEVRTDVMGNVISRLDGQGNSRPKVMLAGHCDEIGFMIKYIDEEGFIYFAPIGGVDAHLVPGQRVHVHSVNGPILGVVGKKPIHLMEPKDRETVVKFKDQFIDIGCASRDEALELVAMGDPMTFVPSMERLQGELVTSRAFDDKMGAFIVTRVLQEVKQRGPAPADLYSVTTVQEEIGLRGASASVYGVNPDVGIAVDVGFSSDFPGLNKTELGDLRVGQGPIIARGANINPVLFDLLVATAQEESIPYQVVGMPRATGTDANVMQLSRGGVAAALVSVPLRYMHSPVEVLSLADLEATIALLAAVIYKIDNAGMFIPQ